MATANEVAEQADTRFGRKGLAAWVYFAWPLGPFPGAVISAWAVLHFAQKEDSAGEVGVFLFVFIFCVWLCLVSILITKEALRTAQRIEFDNNSVVIYRYIGSRIVVNRDDQTEIVPIRMSRTRKILMLWIGLISDARDNWLVRLSSGDIIVMNGEAFAPHSIFRSKREKGCLSTR